MPEKMLKVKLLSHTPDPVNAIALAGRLCYSDSDISSLKEAVAGKSESFLEKLLSLGHLSAIEHVTFTFAVEGVSRALLAQITRHRIASFSVQSQRYVQNVEMNYIIPPSIKALGEEAVKKYEAQMEQLHGFYIDWTKAGIPSEDARFLLPNAAETRMIVTMNARELMHFLALRCCNRAQWEIRCLAWTMLALLRAEAPAMFANVGCSCLNGTCSEGKMSCKLQSEMVKLSRDLDEFLLSSPSEDDIVNWVYTSLTQKN